MIFMFNFDRKILRRHGPGHGDDDRRQVEAPVEMASFSVVLPCAFEGEFAEKTVCLERNAGFMGAVPSGFCRMAYHLVI